MENMYSDLPQSVYDATQGDKFDFAQSKIHHIIRFIKFVVSGLIPLPQMQILYPDFLDY